MDRRGKDHQASGSLPILTLGTVRAIRRNVMLRGNDTGFGSTVNRRPEVEQLKGNGTALAQYAVLVGGIAFAAPVRPRSACRKISTSGACASPKTDSGQNQISTIQVNETTIYYNDRGKGPVITFSHGWQLNSEAWAGHMLFLFHNGYRCVAIDRRGHGRSSQPSIGNDMDKNADDFESAIDALDRENVALIEHSTGCGGVARYRSAASFGGEFHRIVDASKMVKPYVGDSLPPSDYKQEKL